MGLNGENVDDIIAFLNSDAGYLYHQIDVLLSVEEFDIDVSDEQIQTVVESIYKEIPKEYIKKIKSNVAGIKKIHKILHEAINNKVIEFLH